LPRFLTAIMSTPVMSRRGSGVVPFQRLNEAERAEALRSCRAAADRLYAALDLTEETRSTDAQGVGASILEDAGGIAASAVCHDGPRSEAGAGCCFIKFGAVRDGPSAED
jgi:hypothetical protein